MAKATSETVFLVSSAGTGFFYSVKRKKGKEKLNVKKFDPIAKKHVTFQEKKLSKLKKKFNSNDTTAAAEAPSTKAKAA